MTATRKQRRPKIEWKFERVDAGPMSQEDFESFCEIIAQMIYEHEMKKLQTQANDNASTPSVEVDPTRDESAFLLGLS